MKLSIYEESVSKPFRGLHSTLKVLKRETISEVKMAIVSFNVSLKPLPSPVMVRMILTGDGGRQRRQRKNTRVVRLLRLESCVTLTFLACL